MANFTVVFDACVLFPAPLRDALMHLALTDLFKARWTDQIHEEWINALLRTGNFKREQLERVRDLMDQHTRDAKVTGYESLIDGITLPDPKDRHVLAAAIKSNADAIVTMNLKDFPEDILQTYKIDVLHPDDFIYYQIDMEPGICCEAFKRQRLALKNPPYSEEEFILSLQKQQLPQTASALKKYIKFI